MLCLSTNKAYINYEQIQINILELNQRPAYMQVHTRIRKQQVQKEEQREDKELLPDIHKGQSHKFDSPQKLYNSEPCPHEMVVNSFCQNRQTQDENRVQIHVVVFCMIMMVLILSFSLFYKDWITKIIMGLDIAQFQKPGNNSETSELPDFQKILSYKAESDGQENPLYNLCPNSTLMFQTYYNETDRKTRYINEDFLKRAKKCNISIIGFDDLKELRKQWNTNFPSNRIRLSEFSKIEDKELLLILLQLYFRSGTYINNNISYSMINDRCWKYALTGYGIIFADYSEEKDSIFVPDMQKFMKARFPLSVEIRQMIERLIKGEDVLQKCRKEQCLIIKCYNS